MTIRKTHQAGFAGAVFACALMVGPVMAGSAVPVLAQTTTSPDTAVSDSPNWTAPRGYDMAYPENGHPNMVARQGYAAGYNEGQADAVKGKKFTPTENKAYGKAIIPQGMNKDEFKQQYREAFVKGYSAGYKGE